MHIIAEAGVNHNGSPELAAELATVSAAAGADVVKFQTFQTSKLVTGRAARADYQSRNIGSGSQADMLAALELPQSVFVSLAEHCRKAGIAFLSTPFDEDSARFLVEELGCDTIKIGSGDLLNLPLVMQIGRSDAHAILSTGMASLGDVELALGAFAWGMSGRSDLPTSSLDLIDAYADVDHDELRRRATLLHCTTEYPAPPESINLKAVQTLRAAFGLETGFSDHSEGDWAALAACALGATVLEKHITLDRNMEGPDHRASMEPGPFKEMVARIRLLQSALGDGRKRAVAAERANRPIAEKRVLAARDLPAGHVVRLEDVALKRSADGARASMLFDILGRALPEATARDDGIG